LIEAVELTNEVIQNPRPEPGSPTPNEIQELFAAANQNLGVEYLREGKLPETATVFTSALNAQARVLENIRAEPGFADLDENQRDGRTANQQIAHDKAALGLAYILVRLGRTEESIAMYDKAIAGRREIYARRPTMLPLKVELAGHLGNYGNACLWIDQPDKAEPLLTESLQLSEEIYAADPEKADYKRALTLALYRMGTLRDVQGRAEEALASFERSRLLRSELASTSADEKNQINLMLAEARVGNMESAGALINQLGGSTNMNGELHLERARALAQLTRRAEGEQRTQFRDAALTALERAVTEGYSDPFRVNSEQDLDPLHEEDRFKAVVARLKSAATAHSATAAAN
jgi:tetratricopeptide (TPR) repeat protein